MNEQVYDNRVQAPLNVATVNGQYAMIVLVHKRPIPTVNGFKIDNT